MTDDCGDLDPYLADLLAFKGSASTRDHVGMDAIPITMEQLAREAGKWFYGLTLPEVPAKLWLDAHAATGQIYLRATFDQKGMTTKARVRLQGLAVALDGLYGTELITVAYPEDHTWEEIDDMNRALNRVA